MAGIQKISKLREVGRNLQDQGVFEFNLINGELTWANNFALEKMGYTLDQFQRMTVFDVVPERFHEQIREKIAANLAGKPVKFSIWPGKAADGKIVWWYIFQTETDHPIHWSYGDYLETTDQQGVAYAFMRMTMDTASGYGQLQGQVNDLDEWIRDEVRRLDESDNSIRQSVVNIDNNFQHVLTAATTAADASMSNGKALQALDTRMDSQTTEILRLIGTDEHHKRRMEEADQYMKTTAEVAMKAITQQANKESAGLSKKVTSQFSWVMVFATIVQWLIQHWDVVTKHIH